MKLRPFEITLLVAFGVMALAALIILRTFSPSGENQNSEEFVGPVQIWGVLPAAAINTVLDQIKDRDENYKGVTYRHISPDSFDDTLIRALADGGGPDVILITHQDLVQQRKRILPYSYQTWPLGDFRDLYLDGAQIFALSDGLYGTPLLVDPLMMYWNKDILFNDGFLRAPATWEELTNVQLPVLVDRSFDRTIVRAVVPFGIYENSRNAYGILSTLLLQSGSQFVTESLQYNRVNYSVDLDETISSSADPFFSSLAFYLRFSQPANTLYSWNRAFSQDRNEFISADLVFYFGYGSEGRVIEELNPNLNFDIAEMPQGDGAAVRRTYGKFYSLAPMRSADNVGGAFKVISALNTDTNVSAIARAANMVPAKRNLAAAGSTDIYLRMAYRSAPITYGWLNPNWLATDDILLEAVSDINANRSTINNATNEAQDKLSRLYE